MTLLNAIIKDEEVLLITDSLVRENSSELFSHSSKYMIIPHLETVITGTGSLKFIAEWSRKVLTLEDIRNINDLNKVASSMLVQQESKKAYYALEPTVIYHLCYSGKLQKYVAYKYKSGGKWHNERIENATVLFPVVNKIKKPETVSELLAVANQQKLEDNLAPAELKYDIGGNIHLVRMSNNVISTETIACYLKQDSAQGSMKKQRKNYTRSTTPLDPKENFKDEVKQDADFSLVDFDLNTIKSKEQLLIKKNAIAKATKGKDLTQIGRHVMMLLVKSNADKLPQSKIKSVTKLIPSKVLNLSMKYNFGPVSKNAEPKKHLLANLAFAIAIWCMENDLKEALD